MFQFLRICRIVCLDDSAYSFRRWCLIDCGSNSGGGERLSAKYSLGFKIVVVEADDVANMPRYRAFNGTVSSHPLFRWEGIDVGR